MSHPYLKPTCTGENSYSQSSIPLEYKENLNINLISSGWDYNCAIALDGILQCWGLNLLGQLDVDLQGGVGC